MSSTAFAMSCNYNFVESTAITSRVVSVSIMDGANADLSSADSSLQSLTCLYGRSGRLWQPTSPFSKVDVTFKKGPASDPGVSLDPSGAASRNFVSGSSSRPRLRAAVCARALQCALDPDVSSRGAQIDEALAVLRASQQVPTPPPVKVAAREFGATPPPVELAPAEQICTVPPVEMRSCGTRRTPPWVGSSSAGALTPGAQRIMAPQLDHAPRPGSRFASNLGIPRFHGAQILLMPAIGHMDSRKGNSHDEFG